jgi:hypothetical protein
LGWGSLAFLRGLRAYLEWGLRGIDEGDKAIYRGSGLKYEPIIKSNVHFDHSINSNQFSHFD